MIYVLIRPFRFVKALGSLVPRPNLSGWTSNDDDLPYTEVHADDEFLIRPNNLAINKDQQIGCGAFARVFLGELQRTAHKQRLNMVSKDTSLDGE